jgi:hypothetical protein
LLSACGKSCPENKMFFSCFTKNQVTTGYSFEAK